MNFKEILKKMDELDITKEVFSGDENLIEDSNCECSEKFKKDKFKIDGLGEIITVLEEGGYDELQENSNGMDWKIVRHFVDHDVYIQLKGYYSSYEGVDLDGVKYQEVKPKEKTSFTMK